MLQKWRKLGLVFSVESRFSWMQTHAAVPTVFSLGGDMFRIFYGTRDKSQRASIGFFDLDLNQPQKVLRVSERPILTPGELGTFDDSGVLPSWILKVEDKIYLYYIGWNLGVTVPFRNFTGLAYSEDGGETFKRLSRAPVADRDEFDPFFFTNPCVLREKDHFKIWYLSAIKWVEQENAPPKHYYHIKQDISRDGITWLRKPTVAIEVQHPDEFAISRPCVIREKDRYSMWYSYRSGPRGAGYRIGYADSTDSEKWTRHDDWVGLDVSESGWDSESIEYGHVFDHKGNRYLFYNGNQFGKTGIGLAVLE